MVYEVLMEKGMAVGTEAGTGIIVVEAINQRTDGSLSGRAPASSAVYANAWTDSAVRVPEKSVRLKDSGVMAMGGAGARVGKEVGDTVGRWEGAVDGLAVGEALWMH